MKVYYRGRLIKNDSSDYSKFIMRFYSKLWIYKNDLRRDELKLNSGEFTYLKNNLEVWVDQYTNITDEELLKVLRKIYKICSKQIPLNSTSIIYEKVKDVDGNIYGKEILTNRLFPLRNDDMANEEFFYNIDNNRCIERRLTFINNNMAKFAFIISPDEVASINEVNEYLEIANNQKELTKHNKEITQIYQENVFNKEIVLEKAEILEPQNEITKIMENIEFVLNTLKHRNEKLYKKHNIQYEKVCNFSNNSNNYVEPDKQELLNILSNIKLSFLLNQENCDNIIDYLNLLITTYLNKLINNEIDFNDVNAMDIENFTDLFLKSKNNYTIQEQRLILTKISMLYLLVAKTNIDNINISSLENSYFKDNTKTIILNICALKELGLIDVNINDNSIEDFSIENVLNIIGSIEFNKFEKESIKKMIK